MNEKILICKRFEYIIKTKKGAEEECRLLPYMGNCIACPENETRDLKEVPDLLKGRYRTV